MIDSSQSSLFELKLDMLGEILKNMNELDGIIGMDETEKIDSLLDRCRFYADKIDEIDLMITVRPPDEIIRQQREVLASLAALNTKISDKAKHAASEANDRLAAIGRQKTIYRNYVDDGRADAAGALIDLKE